MGFLSGLFGGGDSQSSSTTTSSTTLPSYVTDASKQMAGQAQNVASQPFQAYTNPLVANLSSGQNAGIGMAGQSPWQGNLNSARSSIGAGSTMFPNANIGAYMNPYVQQSIDPVARTMQRNFQGQNNQLRDQAAASGAFGGSRPALMQSEAYANQNRQIGDLYSQGYNSAFNNAQGQFNQDMQRQLQAGGMYGNLAGMQGQLQNQQFNQNMMAGGVDQQNQQAKLNAQYQQFLRGQGWDAQQLQLGAGVLGSLPHDASQTGTQTGTQPGGSQGGNIMGGLSSLAGLYQMFTTPGSTPPAVNSGWT